MSDPVVSAIDALRELNEVYGLDSRDLQIVCSGTVDAARVRRWLRGQDEIPEKYWNGILQTRYIARQLSLAGITPDRVKLWFLTRSPVVRRQARPIDAVLLHSQSVIEAMRVFIAQNR